MTTSFSARSAALMARPALFLLTVLAALALLGSSARQANATIYYVAPSGTGNGASWATAGPFQAIVTAAHPGDQVWVKYGLYTGNFTATDGVVVYGHFVGTETSLSQRPLTNARYVSTLNANNSGTVYAIPSAATGTNTLDGFTVQGGPVRGLDDHSGDKLVVANCIFSNNSVTNNGNGGGLYTQGTTATISNSTFTGNTATNDQGGGTNEYGGGVYIGGNTTATFNTCYFTGNSVTQTYYAGGYGGAIYSAGMTTLNTCTISSNNASSQGGGVYAVGNAITVQNNCTFTSNTNGGVYAGANSNTISDCTFTSNSGRGAAVFGSNSSTISGCTFASNVANNAGNGAGLYAGSISTVITGCAFNNNSATNDQGGDVEYGGGLYLESGTTTSVSGCSFTGNSATQTYYSYGTGGGIGGFGTPYVTNCTFTSNSPDEINLEDVGTNSSPALIADNLIYGSGTSAGNGIDLGIAGGSTTFAYVAVSNNDIVDANAALNVGTGSATGGEVDVANNVFYANGGAVNYNASATFVSSHDDLFGNGYKYQGVSLSASDLTVDPKFVRNPNFSASPVDYGDLHLTSGSPLIDAGDDSYVSPGDTDLDGNARIQGSHVDIGAYESLSNSAAQLTSLSPSSVQAGHNSFTLTINGTGFASGAVAHWNNTALTTTVVSATQLTATVPASLVASAGTASITATNPGMAVSNSLTFTVTAAATLTSLSPTSAPAAGPAFTLTVNGTGFVSGAVVLFNGATLSTTFVSSTKLMAVVPAADIATTGTAVVTAANPNSSATSPLTFTITTPIATLTSLSPSIAQAGSGTFTLTLTGANFVSGAVVRWNGTALPSGYFSSTTVVAQVPASDLTTTGTAQITVVNPGAGASNALTFTVTPVPAPAQLTSLAPSTAAVGSGTFTLIVNGSGFVSGAVVQWNGVALMSAYLTPNVVVAQVPASDLTMAGAAQITVVNPGAGASNALTFTVTGSGTPPTLTGFSPRSGLVGTVVTITGTNFTGTTSVTFHGTAATFTVVSSTQINATVAAGTTTGTFSVTTPGGTATSSSSFTVTPPPTLSGYSPKTGPVGTVVTITGANFTGATSVTFHGTAATFTVVSSTQINATVAAGTTTGTFSVTTPGGTATSSSSFTVTP